MAVMKLGRPAAVFQCSKQDWSGVECYRLRDGVGGLLCPLRILLKRKAKPKGPRLLVALA